MLSIVIDDTVRVSEDVAALTGVSHFGNLRYRRQTLVQHLESAARAAGLDAPVVLSSQQAVLELEQRLVHQNEPGRFLLFPSNIVALTPRQQLITLLKQLRYAPDNLQLPVTGAPEWSGLLVLDEAMTRRYLASLVVHGCATDFIARHGRDLAALDNDLQLIDLRDPARFLIFLTSNFDVRHFNAIVNENFTIVKRSTDKSKLKREFIYYGLLPPHVQMFFVQPFDYEEHSEYASYRMERLFLPDMAIQWVHDAVQHEEFERLLKRIFHFIDVRPARAVAREQALAVLDRMYWDKVAERIAEFKRMPQYDRLGPLIDQAVGGIDQLLTRYKDLYFAARDRFPLSQLTVGHGDLCFSNMLYSKSTQLLRFIDPRGATVEDDLYTDPYYDLAKLSHSIQGGYDFINSGSFSIDMNAGLEMSLQTDEGDRGWAHDLFRAMLIERGFDPLLVRLCEASLFISMLPLHIDIPKKVLAFVLNAASILDVVSCQTRQN